MSTALSLRICQNLCISWTKAALSVLTFSINAGCASLPSDWPQPRTAAKNECPDISGAYRNNGKSASYKWGAKLSLTLFPEARSTLTESDMAVRRKFGEATRVKIEGPTKGVLTAQAWKDQALIGRVELKEDSRGGFTCAAGQISLGMEIDPGVGLGIYVGATTAYLVPAIDKSLLVNIRGSGGGLVFYIIPIGFVLEDWNHYEIDNSP